MFINFTFGDFLYYAFFVVGLLAIFGAVFGVVFNKYEKWESDIRIGISDYASELYEIFDKMFMRRPLNHCYAMIVGSTGVLGFLGLIVGLKGGLMGSLIFGAVFAFVGFKLPGVVVRTMFSRRLDKFDEQLVDALNMMANAIQSGLSFLQVIQLLERELPNPASQEFAMVLKENRIGVSLNDALLNMTKRIPSQDLFMIMNSVVTLSQQGGDLSEAFETIAFTIRERRKVSDKIKTMSAAGITQGIILSSLPFVMMGLLYLMQPDYIGLLFTTDLGLVLIAVMFIFIGMGALWIKKILTIEI